MHFVLDEEVDQGYEGCKECSAQIFPVLDRLGIWWAESNTANGPGQSGDKIADHENVMPVMVIGARHISPTSASQGPEHADSGNELGQAGARAIGKAVPEEAEGESGT